MITCMQLHCDLFLRCLRQTPTRKISLLNSRNIFFKSLQTEFSTRYLNFLFFEAQVLPVSLIDLLLQALVNTNQ